jgi:hypothetical protein
VTIKDLAAAVIIPLILAEVGPWCGWLAAGFLPLAARLRYGHTDRAAVWLEEWSGDLDGIPGQLTKLGYAVGQFVAGSAAFAGRRAERWISGGSGKAATAPNPAPEITNLTPPAGYGGPTTLSVAGNSFQQLPQWIQNVLTGPTMSAMFEDNARRIAQRTYRRLLDEGYSPQQIRTMAARKRREYDKVQVTPLSDGASAYRPGSNDELVDLLRLLHLLAPDEFRRLLLRRGATCQPG